MAKTRGGAIVGQVSGSVGSNVFSRNRFGTYIRNRSVPVNPDSGFQQNVRSVFSSQSSNWGGLTAVQREAFKTWAQNNPVTDAFGDQQVLTGHQAFIQLNARLAQAGDTPLTVPPISTAPDGLTAFSLEGDIGAGDTIAIFTPTPLAAGERLFLWMCVVGSAGITYVKNRMKLVHISAKALATDYDYLTVVQARFGTLSVGQVVHARAAVFDTTTGLISIPRSASVVVTST